MGNKSTTNNFVSPARDGNNDNSISGQLNGNKNNYCFEKFNNSNKLKWKLDASSGECTGMFWRTAPTMHAISSNTDWPRNGTIFYGWKSIRYPGWIKVDNPNGYWMPIEQHGKTVAHEQK